MQQQQYDDGSQLLAATRASDAHAFIVQIQTRLRELNGSVGTVWTGTAATAFSQVVNEWDPQFTAVIRSLERIATTLKDSDISYQNSQTSAEELTQQLKAALGGDPAAVV
ncbi:WXG100 family type VII secretion target [Streptosporangium sp. KLBMP 9127]|nr:WXG100 family type VII secretion target [Streptosporangium sp. KLBMP 9127]